MECEIMHVIAEEARESYRCAPSASATDASFCPVMAATVVLAEAESIVIKERLLPSHLLASGVRSAAAARREDVVQVLPSNTVEELEDNVVKTVAWLKQAIALRC